MNNPHASLPLFDAHAHMYAAAFASDLEEVLSRATGTDACCA